MSTTTISTGRSHTEWLDSLAGRCRDIAVDPGSHYLAVVGDVAGMREGALMEKLSRQLPESSVCSLGGAGRHTALAVDGGREAGDLEQRLWRSAARSPFAGGPVMGVGPALLGWRGLRASVLVAGWVALHASARDDCWRIAALVSVFAQDPARARSFVHTVLGPLADGSAAAARDRRTLTTYLESGRSLVQAAELEHVHRNTVVYRIRRVSERLPVPLDGAEVDLLCALRVIEVLGLGGLDELALPGSA